MKGMNFVTLGPNQIYMPAGVTNTRQLFKEHGNDCHTVKISELTRAAGGIGCMSGILERKLV